MKVGVILLASGDPFLVVNEAGNGSTWSYTATANLVITCYGNGAASDTRIGTWVASTSGTRYYSAQGNSTAQNMSNYNKSILLSGTTITMNNTNVDVNGNYIGGFEL